MTELLANGADWKNLTPETTLAADGSAVTKLAGAPAGTYLVEVDAFALGTQDPAPYSLRVYDLGGTPSVGELAVSPDPVPVTTGARTSFEASWSGLEPQAHYFGLLGYDGAPGSTALYVDTTTP